LEDNIDRIEQTPNSGLKRDAMLMDNETFSHQDAPAICAD
jgi:hypothetical protein